MRIQKILIVVAVAVIGYRLLTYGIALTVNEGLYPSRHLPQYLRAKPHKDYTFLFKIFSWIPWEYTSWHFAEPPVMLAGNQGTYHGKNGLFGPKPVPERGSWQFSYVKVREDVPFCILFYFAFTTGNGIHFRVGEFRWDDVDGYYVGPTISLKYIKKPSTP